MRQKLPSRSRDLKTSFKQQATVWVSLLHSSLSSVSGTRRFHFSMTVTQEELSRTKENIVHSSIDGTDTPNTGEQGTLVQKFVFTNYPQASICYCCNSAPGDCCKRIPSLFLWSCFPCSRCSPYWCTGLSQSRCRLCLLPLLHFTRFPPAQFSSPPSGPSTAALPCTRWTDPPPVWWALRIYWSCIGDHHPVCLTSTLNSGDHAAVL